MSHTIELAAAVIRLLAAVRAVEDVQHAGERDPTRAEDQELLNAMNHYGNLARSAPEAEHTTTTSGEQR